MSKVAKLILEHTKIHHIEFNIRKYSIRDVYRILSKAKLEARDIISDNNVHLVIIRDICDKVYMRINDLQIVGMNIFEHVYLLYKDKPIGVKCVLQKDIQYFSPELKTKHMEYLLSRMGLSGESSWSGALTSPDDSQDEIFD